MLPGLSYLIQHFEGGEVVHVFLFLRLHLHIAPSFSVDAFMPDVSKADSAVLVEKCSLLQPRCLL